MTDLPRTDDTSLLDAFAHPDVPDPDADSPDEIEPGDRDDDLAAALAGAAPRRWWNRGTLVLGACALLLAGFLGGVLVEQRWGTTAGANGASANRGTSAAGFAGGAGRGTGSFGGGQGAPGSAGGGTSAPAATTGTVKLVDGTTLYVQTPNGDVVTVRTNARTSVRTTTASKIGNVRAGQAVTVEGPAATDGTVTATSVTASGK